jgi:hypothetical protein
MSEVGEGPHIVARATPAVCSWVGFQDADTRNKYEIDVHPWLEAAALVGTMWVRDAADQLVAQETVFVEDTLWVGRPPVVYEAHEHGGHLVHGDRLDLGRIAFGSLQADRRHDAPGI